jgi:hypothetical protein
LMCALQLYLQRVHLRTYAATQHIEETVCYAPLTHPTYRGFA